MWQEILSSAMQIVKLGVQLTAGQLSEVDRIFKYVFPTYLHAKGSERHNRKRALLVCGRSFVNETL